MSQWTINFLNGREPLVIEGKYFAEAVEAYLQKNNDLSYANLSHADLNNAFLINANLSHADLRCAYLNHTVLSNADLRYADLNNAFLNSADLSNANLSNADLSHAKLNSTILSDADWQEVKEEEKELKEEIKVIVTDIPKRIIDDIFYEYLRAKVKHPEFPTDPFQAMCIIQEELGEAIQALNNFKHHQQGCIDDVQIELLHTIVTCIRTLKEMDK